MAKPFTTFKNPRVAALGLLDSHVQGLRDAGLASVATADQACDLALALLRDPNAIEAADRPTAISNLEQLKESLIKHRGSITRFYADIERLDQRLRDINS